MSIPSLILFLLVFLPGEVIAYLVFRFLNKKYLSEKGNGMEELPSINPIIKGIIERLVIFTGLVHGFPQIIIAFGAFKIATRLHDHGNEHARISNDYFLAGNLISLFFAMLYAIIYNLLSS